MAPCVEGAATDDDAHTRRAPSLEKVKCSLWCWFGSSSRANSLPVRELTRRATPQLTGEYERGFPGARPDVTLRYGVVRVWQVLPQEWLSGGVGLLPLAPLGAAEPEQLPAVIARMKQRLDREVPPREAADLWSATYILMGLRYDEAVVERLLQGVHQMEESSTYQAILRKGEAQGRAEGEAKGKAKGKADEARRLLLMLGREQFGEPSAAERAALAALTNVHRLEQLALQVKNAPNWQALLASSGRRRGAPRRKPSA